jgi:hypothetical protein
MKIYIENSSWNNVGDFFYQNSILEIFKNLFKDFNICSFDAPIQRSFKINNIFFKNALNLRDFIDGDIFVLSGPILGSSFLKDYGEFIKRIYSQKKKYLILSAYGKDLDENKNFLKKYPPYALSTRSTETYEIYKDCTFNSYNGICNAFFLPFFSNVPIIKNKKYIVKSFYSMHEPDLSFNTKNDKIDINSICLKYKKSYFWKLYRHFNYFIKSKDQINDYEIFRVHHDLSYKFNHLNFSKKNSYLSYNINNYLSIYHNAKLVLSDRVHSVVLGLAYGVPAMLCGKWDRSSLLEKLKLKKINECYLPPKRSDIHEELENYKSWLKSLF